MKMTDALLGEHGVFYAQFDHLEQVVPTITDVAQVRAEGGLLAAGLAPHALMENELLFPALEPHLGTGTGPVAVMRMEHNEIESGLVQLQAVDDLEEAQELLLNTIALARQHFAKEERILFPAAVQVLSEKVLTELGRQWAQRRRVAIG